jgi:hypothetical protein
MSEVKETAPQVATEKKEPEYMPGDRGELGQPTASLTMKQRYHAAHFTREDAGDKRNPHKKVWVINSHAPSLKQFARKLLAQKDEVAVAWFGNKNGALNAKRSDANEKIQREAASATKLGRKKSKNSGGSSGGAK